MIVLALDAATEVLTIALCNVQSKSSWTLLRRIDRGLRHTGVLMPHVQSVLEEAELSIEEIDLIACSRGPGSFTGLRIGFSTAKGLAEAIAAKRGSDHPPLLSVPTLEAMIQALPQSGTILAVIDGRKGRYYGLISSDEKVADGPFDLSARETVQRVSRLTSRSEPVVVTGPHADRFLDELAELSGETAAGARFVLDPRHRSGWAVQIARMAAERVASIGYDPRNQGPDYIRISDAEIGITK